MDPIPVALQQPLEGTGWNAISADSKKAFSSLPGMFTPEHRNDEALSASVWPQQIALEPKDMIENDPDFGNLQNQSFPLAQEPSPRRTRKRSKSSSTASPTTTTSGSSSRSERARNAANQRHARAKETPIIEQESTRKDVEREKNRISAAKCRQKKREINNALDAEYRAYSAANSAMRREHRDLRDQLTFWRALALQHMEGDCNCHAIQRYNHDQAMKAAFDTCMDHSQTEPGLANPHLPKDNIASAA
jgi:hypothetical protein